MRIGPYGEVILSKRNLLALLHKVDQEESARTIYRRTEDGRLVIVRAEPDQAHYSGREPGQMASPTEAFIQERTGAEQA